MSRIVLVHWNEAEAVERAARLERAGHDVVLVSDPRAGANELRAFRADPPDAFVIDLGRLPSQGRAVATYLRQQKATRHVPLVFVEGSPENIAKTRELIPDASHADWRRVRGAVRDSIRAAPRDPVVPGTMAGYSGTPLPKKLGIRAGRTVALLYSPDGFAETLGALPADVRVRGSARGQPADIAILFVRSRAELGRRFASAARAVAEGGRLWIAWPKKAAGTGADIGERDVRAFGLDQGWVDFKIAAIDATWSGLCFSRRKR